MGAPCFVFHHVHPMLGLDLENCIFPPAPAIVPFIPYVTVSILSGNMLQSKYTVKTFALMTGIRVMQKETDCGYLGVPHFGNMANPLLVTIMAFSKSKSTFSASTVKVENSPTAIAIPFTFGINTNCGTVSTPTGIVICPTTIFAGMTLADAIMGVLGYLQDLVIDIIFNKLFGDSSPGSAITHYITSRIMGRVWGSALSRLLPNSLMVAHEAIREFIENAVQEIAENLMPDGNPPNQGSGTPSGSAARQTALTPAVAYASSDADTFGA